MQIDAWQKLNQVFGNISKGDIMENTSNRKTKPIHAGCACGSVEFMINHSLREVIFCHCRQCRQLSGHFVAATNVVQKALQFIHKKGLKWYRSSDFAKPGFCKECGSNLFYMQDNNETVSISAGCIDYEGEYACELTPGAHIYVAEKPTYYQLQDDLPQYPTTMRIGN